ncbi:MAG TPA: ABC transporter permease [Tepidisphaeraceae bacterium]|nr:ABC transporter permease [Tepidisphaeraceae bacterium]
MSDPATAIPLAPRIGGDPVEPPRRTYAAEVWHRTFATIGAKLGAAWIIVMVFCAVLAPFLASSFPLLLKQNNHWSSPVLHYLNWVDVTLLCITFVGVICLILRTSFKLLVLAVLAALAISAPLTIIFINPPATVVYERYRQLAEQGKYQVVIWAPIPYSPGDHLRDHPEERLAAPSSKHWMGTEINSADVLSRILFACRIALSIGFISTGIAIIIGIVVGGLMGYFAGIPDILGMRLIEIFEAIPTLFLLITFVAFFGRNLYIIMVIIGLTSWTGYARFLRAEFLKLRHQDFVQAAVAAGLPTRMILFRHMLPNGITPVLISASFGVASAILAEATLSFLGLGLIDKPSWGALLNQATGAAGQFIWWLAVFPGAAIFLTVYAYNLIGESLRDAIDPTLMQK